ncbi:HTH-like domain-containing protein [Fibrella forsythiae]|uniref:HTH-like domain-containing protein n=1 Tax=Fibrella forsythiae TaxID=2817061 RepID=A0ABS3JUP2_9BACT|nr:hypothetical protein [Fibrella forsythiae]MBO0953173.1 hypothetical protein [Fibrella forsythiae]
MDRKAQRLGQLLTEIYQQAPQKELVVMVNLFGIRYHQEIKEAGVLPIVKASGIPRNYKSEVSKGVKLAKYVTLDLAVDAAQDQWCQPLGVNRSGA